MKEKIADFNTEFSVVETLEKLNLSNRERLSFDEIKDILRVYVADNWDNYKGDGKNIAFIRDYYYPERDLPVSFMYSNNNELKVVKLEQEMHPLVNVFTIYDLYRNPIHKSINFGSKTPIFEYWNKKIIKEDSLLIGVTEIVPKNQYGYSDSDGIIGISSIALEKAAYIGNECLNYLKRSGYLGTQQSKQFYK